MGLIFQYGSNCSDAVINGPERLCGDARFVGVAEANGFRLAFDVWSHRRKCAAADIVADANSTVWGVLYEVPDYLITRGQARARGRKSLDAIEGEGTNYTRTLIQVRSTDGIVHSAITYVVREPKPSLLTNIEYVTHIITGLRSRGVREDYIAKVKVIAAVNNPSIAQALAEI